MKIVSAILFTLLLSLGCIAQQKDSTINFKKEINPFGTTKLNRFQKEYLIEHRSPSRENLRDGVIWAICCWTAYIILKDFTFKNNLKQKI